VFRVVAGNLTNPIKGTATQSRVNHDTLDFSIWRMLSQLLLAGQSKVY